MKFIISSIIISTANFDILSNGDSMMIINHIESPFWITGMVDTFSF